MLAEKISAYEEIGTYESDHKLNQRIRRYLALSSKKIKKGRYTAFYVEGKGLNARNFAKNSDEKKKLLEDFFPKRFGRDGVQPILSYEPVQIGALFNKVMHYAETEAEQ